jgi:hypothetical protein
VLRLLKLARQRFAVWTGRAATDVAALFFGCTLSGAAPWAVVGHRAFDAKPAGVEVGDNQEEGLGGAGIGHMACRSRSWQQF